MAQFAQNLFNSPNQQLVEIAVKNGIVLLQSDYQLLDTTNNTRYGWNNQNVFNSIYSIGVKIENGFLVTEDFITPWKNDSRFNNLSNNVYVPIITNSYNKTIDDSLITKIYYIPDNTLCLNESSVYKIDSIPHEDRGFTIDISNGDKEGWLVWILCPDSVVDKKSNLSVLTYKYNLNISGDRHVYSLPEPSTSENVVGGFYVVPNNNIIGVLDFQLVGFAFRNDMTWNLACCNETEISSPDENTSNITVIPDNEVSHDSINIVNDEINVDKINDQGVRSNKKKKRNK